MKEIAIKYINDKINFYNQLIENMSDESKVYQEYIKDRRILQYILIILEEVESMEYRIGE